MTNKKKRIIHSPEFKAETLKLAEKVGVAAAAKLKRLLAEQAEELDIVKKAATYFAKI